MQARASTWSNYKHKNAVKVLLGIVSQGAVLFVSQGWGGRVSDKHLTEHSGILLPGDVVLADRGFDISESVGVMQARLHIPAFTKGKDQLSALEVYRRDKIYLLMFISMLNESLEISDKNIQFCRVHY